MDRTVRLEDMRLFAAVAEAKSFTAAGRRLGMPKQTLSRRIAELEAELDAQLLIRSTRTLKLTDVGGAYAVRCAELVRLADEANRSVTDTRQTPSGRLRVTADPTFGDAFVGSVVNEYARKWPKMEVEVVLARRRMDLIEEGLDVAFRIGQVGDPRLTATSLGPARVRYCASPSYVRRRGKPRTPDELPKHELVVVTVEGAPAQWPFATSAGLKLVTVEGRLRFTSFGMAHAAVLAGLGIGIFPEFACADDLRRKRLVSVFPDAVAVGAVWIAYPTQRYLSARVRSFVDLAVARMRTAQPWVPDAAVRASRGPRRPRTR